MVEVLEGIITDVTEFPLDGLPDLLKLTVEKAEDNKISVDMGNIHICYGSDPDDVDAYFRSQADAHERLSVLLDKVLQKAYSQLDDLEEENRFDTLFFFQANTFYQAVYRLMDHLELVLEKKTCFFSPQEEIAEEISYLRFVSGCYAALHTVFEEGHDLYTRYLDAMPEDAEHLRVVATVTLQSISSLLDETSRLKATYNRLADAGELHYALFYKGKVSPSEDTEQ